MSLRTSMSFGVDRSMDPRLAVSFAQAVAESGVIDEIMCFDQVQGWWHDSLHTVENSPSAAFSPDPNSFHEGFMLAAMIAATTDIGVAISSDAIRRGPGELMMAMMTLASATEGRATLMLGAGEVKQVRPLGYKRSEGLARLEDFFQLRERFMNADGPFDFAGNHWNMKGAWLGATRPYGPKILAMGGGPILLDLATKYADGITTVVPMVFSHIEDWESYIKSTDQQLEDNGRDPDEFDYSIWVPCLLHEDPARLEQAYDNPLIRTVAAVFGRLNQRDWAREGLPPVFPEDWHYALKYIPANQTAEEAKDVADRTTPAMVQKGLMCGSPDEIAERVKPWVEAGANHVMFFDIMSLVLPIEEAMTAGQRSIDASRRLKEIAG